MNLASAFGAFLDPVADKARDRPIKQIPRPKKRRCRKRLFYHLTRHTRPHLQLMVAAALVLLSTAPPPVLASSPAWLIPAPAVAIIGREITMSGAQPFLLGADSRNGSMHGVPFTLERSNTRFRF